MRSTLLVSTLLAALFALPSFASAQNNPYAGGKPPEKKEKLESGGQTYYICSTSEPEYEYSLWIPSTYSEDNPAGLLLFFHGQGTGKEEGKRMAGRWDPYNKRNFICINMMYHKFPFGNGQWGDNTKDVQGKVKAAKQAIAQTMAEYKIVMGRGVVASFSGGGIPLEMFLGETQKSKLGENWPFAQVLTLSSNAASFRSSASFMSWCVFVGTKEWNLADLGSTALSRYKMVLAGKAGGPMQENLFYPVKGMDHEIKQTPEVDMAAEVWDRIEADFVPYIYTPDYTEKELATCVRLAQSHEYEKAMTELTKVRTDAKVPAEKLDKLEKLIKKQQEHLSKVANDLVEKKDLVPACYYLDLLVKRAPASEEAKAAKTKSAELRKSPEYTAQAAARAIINKWLPDALQNGVVTGSAKGVLEQLVKKYPDTPASKYATMLLELGS